MCQRFRLGKGRAKNESTMILSRDKKKEKNRREEKKRLNKLKICFAYVIWTVSLLQTGAKDMRNNGG